MCRIFCNGYRTYLISHGGRSTRNTSGLIQIVTRRSWGESIVCCYLPIRGEKSQCADDLADELSVLGSSGWMGCFARLASSIRVVWLSRSGAQRAAGVSEHTA